jgi:hypothetical protein
LLENAHDGMPILAELKIRSDKPAYFALIQVLMLAAELQSPSQRTRLQHHREGQTFRWSVEGPFTDLYMIAFESPVTGRYRERLLNATRRISELLVRDAKVAPYIRRIAYLEASASGDDMTFEKRFAFGLGM